MSFSDKVVIVTGGSSGIGASIAIAFAKEQANVAIVGRSEAKLKNVADQISKVGKPALIIKADIATEEINNIVKKTIGKFGKLDILINNAGMLKKSNIGDENLVQVYDEVVNTNLRSVVALTNSAYPHLVASKGNIVNISSAAGQSTVHSLGPGYAAYCVSKAGLEHFSRIAALEFAPKGVRVNIVSPGPVETPILDTGDPSATWDEVKKVTALNILSQPEEIADLVLYLTSDKARSITGSNYVIDAGYLIN